MKSDATIRSGKRDGSSFSEELGRGNVSEGIRSLIRLYTAPSYPASDVER